MGMQLTMHTQLKKCTYKPICVVILLGVVIFGITTQYNTQMYIIHWELTNDITCHDQMDGNSLTELGINYTPPSKSIFMHETSCRGGLNSRQACAVESAARAHPNWQIHMLFSGPVSKYVLERSCLAILTNYTNIRLFRIHLKDYAKGTPVESLVASKSYERSPWRVEHTSDMLRYLTLYKFGGTYMDSDVVVLKSFDTLAKNWAARESWKSVDSGLMTFSNDTLGRMVAEATIQ